MARLGPVSTQIAKWTAQIVSQSVPFILVLGSKTVSQFLYELLP